MFTPPNVGGITNILMCDVDAEFHVVFLFPPTVQRHVCQVNRRC